MDAEKRRADSLKAMVERLQKRSKTTPDVTEDLDLTDRGPEMNNDHRGVKKAPQGLTIFGDTGLPGSDAVQIVPRLPGSPVMPQSLDQIAQEEWVRITTILSDLGSLSPAYGSALELYCIQYSRMRQAEAHIIQHGMVVTRRFGITVQSPYVVIARAAAQFCQKALASFGLDPTSAKGVAAPPVKDALEEFLTRHA